MDGIRRRVGIAAPQTRVYQAVATREGLSGWRTREVDGDPGACGTLQSCFGQPEPGTVMEVIALTPARHVRWRCARGPGQWADTKLTVRRPAWSHPNSMELSCRQRSRSQIRDAPTELLHPRAELGDRCPQAQMGRHIPRRSDSAI
jgi:hypothetical protein